MILILYENFCLIICRFVVLYCFVNYVIILMKNDKEEFIEEY